MPKNNCIFFNFLKIWEKFPITAANQVKFDLYRKVPAGTFSSCTFCLYTLCSCPLCSVSCVLMCSYSTGTLHRVLSIRAGCCPAQSIACAAALFVKNNYSNCQLQRWNKLLQNMVAKLPTNMVSWHIGQCWSPLAIMWFGILVNIGHLWP